MVKISKEAALEYHESGRPGKIEVKPTKAYRTQTDLSLAYSPGVAFPCLEIQEDPDAAYKYTDKGNLVAVISNGTSMVVSTCSISRWPRRIPRSSARPLSVSPPPLAASTSRTSRRLSAFISRIV